MLNTIIIILLIIWLLGYFGPSRIGVPDLGGAVHFLLVLVILIILLRALGIL